MPLVEAEDRLRAARRGCWQLSQETGTVFQDRLLPGDTQERVRLEGWSRRCFDGSEQGYTAGVAGGLVVLIAPLFRIAMTLLKHLALVVRRGHRHGAAALQGNGAPKHRKNYKSPEESPRTHNW